MDACIWGQVEVVKVLLDRGADVKLFNKVRSLRSLGHVTGYVLFNGCGRCGGAVGTMLFVARTTRLGSCIVA